MSNFSIRLKELRNSKELTQKQMAKTFNITERGYQNYEMGKSTPNFEVLVSLADFFDISLDYLTGRTNNPEINCSNNSENPEPALRAASGLTEDTNMDAVERVFDMLNKLAEEKKNNDK